MRIEIGGAMVTDAVVEVLDTLHNRPEIVKTYINVIDEITRSSILDISGDEEDDVAIMARLRALQMMRRDIKTLATPPDSDDPANDIPAVSI